MAIITEIFPICDVCHEPYADNKHLTVKACREAMNVNGWRVVKGLDVCYECSKDVSTEVLLLAKAEMQKAADKAAYEKNRPNGRRSLYAED